MKKRILSLLLCLCMVAAFLPMAAWATDDPVVTVQINSEAKKSYNDLEGFLTWMQYNAPDEVSAGSVIIVDVLRDADVSSKGLGLYVDGITVTINIPANINWGVDSISVTKSGTLNLNGGKVAAGQNKAQISCKYIGAFDARLNIDNCKVVGSTDSVIIVGGNESRDGMTVLTTGTVNISNSDIVNPPYRGYGIEVKKGDLTVSDSTITAYWDGVYISENPAAEKTITITNTDITSENSAVRVQNGGIANISGGTFTSNSSEAVAVEAGASAEITSGTFTGIRVTGGQVDIGGDAVVKKASGYKSLSALYCDDGGVATISGNAQINSTAFAVEVRGVSGRSRSKVTINGGTIMGGRIQIQGSCECISVWRGDLEINGGTIDCPAGSTGDDALICIAIENGELVVNGGNIGSENCDIGVNISTIRGGSEGDYTYYASKAAINGGTIKAKTCGLMTTQYGEVTISGDAEIGATEGQGVYNGSVWNNETVTLEKKTLTIDGGTIRGGSGMPGLFLCGGTTNINGGTIIGTGSNSALGIMADSTDSSIPIDVTIQGGVLKGGIEIRNADKTLGSLLKSGYTYFKDDGAAVAASELTGKTLTGIISVASANGPTISDVSYNYSTGALSWKGQNIPATSGSAGYFMTQIFDSNGDLVADSDGKCMETVDAENASVHIKVTKDGDNYSCTYKPVTLTAGNYKLVIEYVGLTVEEGSNSVTHAFTVSNTPSGGFPSGGSSGGSSTPSTPAGETTTNPDGSTTTTTEDKTTGTVTETTTKPDGSQTVVETEKDGTVTTTDTDANGNKTETVAKPDGSSVVTVEQADGTTANVTTDAEGKVEAKVSIPEAVVTEAQQSGEAVTLPIKEVQAAKTTESAPVVTVNTGSSQDVKVEIPVAAPDSGTIAILVKPDGTEEIIKTSVPTENGLAVALPDGATVKIVDNSKSFEDVADSHWGSDAVNFVGAREIFAGTGENTFSPEAPMTRAMLMTVLARFDGTDTNGGSTWFEKGMSWAVENGISDGSAPEANISREQLAVMLWRYSGSPDMSGSLNGFADAGTVSDYAADAMRWAVQKGVINGYGNGQLGPKGEASRAQVSQILKNFIMG